MEQNSAGTKLQGVRVQSLALVLSAYNDNRCVIAMVCKALVQTLSQGNTSCSPCLAVLSTDSRCFSCPLSSFFFFISLLEETLKKACNSKAFLLVDETGECMVSVEEFPYSALQNLIEVDSLACWDSAFASVKQKQYI